MEIKKSVEIKSFLTGQSDKFGTTYVRTFLGSILYPPNERMLIDNWINLNLNIMH